MDKKAVGLSIVSLTAAATLFGATAANAQDVPPILECDLKVGCPEVPGPGDPFWKLSTTVFHKIQTDVFYKLQTTVFLKYGEDAFHKFDDAFHKFQDLFHKD